MVQLGCTNKATVWCKTSASDMQVDHAAFGTSMSIRTVTNYTGSIVE